MQTFKNTSFLSVSDVLQVTENTQISKITHSVLTFDWLWVLSSHPAVERCHVFRSALFLMLSCAMFVHFMLFLFNFFFLFLSCICQQIEYFLTYGPLKAFRHAHMGLFSQSTGCHLDNCAQNKDIDQSGSILGSM